MSSKSRATHSTQRSSMPATAASAQLSEVMFARSTGLPPQLGKATSELRCKVPDMVKDDFVRLAHSVGMSEGEFLRLRVMVLLYGEGEVKSMYQRRVSMVAGMGSLSAPKEEVA